MDKKNKEIIHYIISKAPRSSVTSLIKLAYLTDLVSLKRRNCKVSNFKYIRYFYGPFDDEIYDILENLLEEDSIDSSLLFTVDHDYSIYTVKEEPQLKELSSEDKSIIDEVLQELSGYGAKTLTEIAYQTEPMKKFNATLGGKEHLNEELILE